MSAHMQPAFDFGQPEVFEPKWKRSSVTFDSDRSRKAKKRGMSAAVEYRKQLVESVQDGMRKLAMSRTFRTVTADDAQKFLIENGGEPGALGNSAGSLFKNGEWEFTGQWVKSSRVSSHSNDLRVWRLK